MAKFKTLQDAVNAINNGCAKAAVAVGAWKKGDKIQPYPGNPAYVNGTIIYVLGPNGGGYNLTLAQVEGAVVSKEELQREISELESQVANYNS